MRRNAMVLGAILLMALATPMVAQEKGKTEAGEKPAAKKEITPLRVQVVFNEYEGEKKIGSLPYTLLVNSDVNGAMASIRMGLRVPIRSGASTFNYMDMGTNIDGRAEKQEDGRFLLSLSVERSSTYAPSAQNVDSKQMASEQPVVQQFRSQLNLLIRDGQTMQSTVSTDPLTGRVIKVEVTVNVVK